MSRDPSIQASDDDLVDDGIITRENLLARIHACLAKIPATPVDDPECIQRTGTDDAIAQLKALALELSEMPDLRAEHAWQRTQYDELLINVAAKCESAQAHMMNCERALTSALMCPHRRSGLLRPRIGKLTSILKPYVGADTSRLPEGKRAELASAADELLKLQAALKGLEEPMLSRKRRACERDAKGARMKAGYAEAHVQHIAFQLEDLDEIYEDAYQDEAERLLAISEIVEALLEKIESASISHETLHDDTVPSAA